MTRASPDSRPHLAAVITGGQSGPPLPWRLRWLGGAVLFALALLAYLGHRPGAHPQTPQFLTEPATGGSLRVTVSATGTLQPTNQVDAGSELSGLVEAVLVDDNDRVRTGQVLARLDVSKLRDQITRSKATLAAAEARVLQTTDGVVSYKTILSVDNSDLSLRPGMTATADITTAQREVVLLVPNAALRFTPTADATDDADTGGGIVSKLLPRPPGMARARKPAPSKSDSPRVWVLRDGQPTPVQVTVGVSDGRLTEVTGGDLHPGTEVVTDQVAASK